MTKMLDFSFLQMEGKPVSGDDLQLRSKKKKPVAASGLFY